MLETDSSNEQEPDYVEYTAPPSLVPSGKVVNSTKRHNDIFDALDIELPSLLQKIFDVAVTICDPFTQPEENDDCILSIDRLADVLLALTYMIMRQDDNRELSDFPSLKFDMSVQFFLLLRKIHVALHAYDELQLRYVANNEDDWFQNVGLWTPVDEICADDFKMNICYSMSCILLVAIYKLFDNNSDDGYNLTLNPYLQHFIKLWKCHTNIILLGLEIDRRLETNETQETPYIIMQVLKGSSAIRYVLAWILNQNPSLLSMLDPEEFENESHPQLSLNDMSYDLTSESLVNFLQPLVRKKLNGGALLIDMRLVIMALFITNAGSSFTSQQKSIGNFPAEAKERLVSQSKPIAELGDLLIDLEYEDQFDEDIRYMFEYDLEDDDEWLDVINEEKEKSTLPGSDANEVLPIGGQSNDKISTAVRSKDNDIEFDELGNDWRDVPRGENTEFGRWFLEVLDAHNNSSQTKNFFNDWNETKEHLEYLTRNNIDSDDSALRGQKLINTIAKCIKDEKDGVPETDTSVTPDKIYRFWLSYASKEAINDTLNNNRLIIPLLNITNFELILRNNSVLGRYIMDEMLMCDGYRRVLIWFLTRNINLSTVMIDYVFELLVGLRGNEDNQPYKFTRKGKALILSDIEKLMLLHEFLTCSAFYLSNNDGAQPDFNYKVVLSESVAQKYMTLICLMINQLIKLGIIDLSRHKQLEDHPEEDIHDYSHDLQVLLVNWVGKLPEARELFFRVKKANYGFEGSQEDVKEIHNDSYDPQKLLELIKKYEECSSLEILDDIRLNRDNFTLLKAFGNRLENCVKVILTNQLTRKNKNLAHIADPGDTVEVFKTFLLNFNTFCKIDIFAETMFGKFEQLASTGEVDTDRIAQFQDNEIESPEQDPGSASASNNKNSDNPNGQKTQSKSKKKRKKSKKKHH